MDDSPKEIILAVDDEIANLQKLQRTFAHHYKVLTAVSGGKALDILEENPETAVIIADQRMPDMAGVDFLKQTLGIRPQAIRIILTGYKDIDVLMEAINSCKVYRYVVKPWDPPDLLMTVERGLEAYRLAEENTNFRKELIRRREQKPKVLSAPRPPGVGTSCPCAQESIAACAKPRAPREGLRMGQEIDGCCVQATA